jgi:hypothetical protein
MKREKVKALVNQAINQATQHLAGARDASLPAFLDAQVVRFLDHLREMQTYLESSANKPPPSKAMAFAIADGWPIESELGKMICAAERAYDSLATHT